MYISYTSNGVKFGVKQNAGLQYSMAGLYSKQTLNVTHVIWNANSTKSSQKMTLKFT
jgi:hypothetical protein